jgi:hypothetical protein
MAEKATFKLTAAIRKARTASAEILRKAMEDLGKASLAMGVHLNEVEAQNLFPSKSDFQTWAGSVTGLSSGTVNRLQVAARVVSETPKAADLSKSYDVIATLDKVPAKDRPKAIREMGKSPSITTAREVSARLAPKPPKTRGKAGDAEKLEKRLAAFAKKHGDAIRQAADTLTDPGLLMITGARLATRTKMGADTPAVIARVLAEGKPDDDDSK